MTAHTRGVLSEKIPRREHTFQTTACQPREPSRYLGSLRGAGVAGQCPITMRTGRRTSRSGGSPEPERSFSKPRALWGSVSGCGGWRHPHRLRGEGMRRQLPRTELWSQGLSGGPQNDL